MSGLISGVLIRSQDILYQGFTGDAGARHEFRQQTAEIQKFESESLMRASIFFLTIWLRRCRAVYSWRSAHSMSNRARS